MLIVQVFVSRTLVVQQKQNKQKMKRTPPVYANINLNEEKCLVLEPKKKKKGQVILSVKILQHIYFQNSGLAKENKNPCPGDNLQNTDQKYTLNFFSED